MLSTCCNDIKASSRRKSWLTERILETSSRHCLFGDRSRSLFQIEFSTDRAPELLLSKFQDILLFSEGHSSSLRILPRLPLLSIFSSFSRQFLLKTWPIENYLPLFDSILDTHFLHDSTKHTENKHWRNLEATRISEHCSLGRSVYMSHESFDLHEGATMLFDFPSSQTRVEPMSFKSVLQPTGLRSIFHHCNG